MCLCLCLCVCLLEKDHLYVDEAMFEALAALRVNAPSPHCGHATMLSQLQCTHTQCFNKTRTAETHIRLMLPWHLPLNGIRPSWLYFFHRCSLDLLRESHHQDVQCCAPDECQSAAPQAFFFPAKCQNPPDFCQKTKTSRITKRNGGQFLSRSEWPEKEVQLRPTETISANF